MATFAYRARNRRGEILEDRMEGPDTMAVAASLRRKGLLVIDVREQGVARWNIFRPFNRVKPGDLVVFTRQLSTMIDAGLPVVRALNVLSEQTENEKLRVAVVGVSEDVEAGITLSGALARRSDVFDRLYVEMVRAGEIGGILDGVLLRVASRLEDDHDLRRKVKSAMTYPAVVLALALAAAAFMLLFIVPIFARMFEDLGGALPLPTRVAMGLSDVLTGVGGVMVTLLLGGGGVAFVRWKKTVRGRQAWDRAVLVTPFKIGDIVRKVALARMARTLGTLSAAGVPILQAIEITAASSGNWVVENALLGSRDAVRGGLPIHKSLEEEPIFPPMVTRMIAVGDETGDLDGMLARIADFYESEVDATVKALTSIIEPIMIVVVGAVVGGIIVAMYLPMFRIFELVG